MIAGNPSHLPVGVVIYAGQVIEVVDLRYLSVGMPFVRHGRLATGWCVLKLSTASRCKSGRGNYQEAT